MTKGTNYSVNIFKKAGLIIALVFALFSYSKTAVAASVPVVISNERIERVGEGSVKVSWSTNIPATGRVVYGSERVPTPGLPLQFEGYQNGTIKLNGPLVFEHSVTLVVEDTSTHFFRPVSKAGDQFAFGKELSLEGTVVLQQEAFLPTSNLTSNQGCLYLPSYLRIGDNNSSQDVIKLQQFLNQFQGENLSVTGVFGEDTRSAVIRFQEKYAGDVLNPWGYDEGTGYVYILTQKKINEIFCNGFFPLTSSQLQEIGDFNVKQSSVSKTSVAEVLPLPIVESIAPVEEIKPIISPIQDIDTASSSKPVIAPITSAGSTGLATVAQSNPQKLAVAPVTVTLEDSLRTNSQGLFSLIFSLPKTSSDLLRNALNFIFILVIVYIVGNIIAHTDDPSVSKQSMRAQKLALYSLGVFLSALVAIFLGLYSLVLPLILISAGIFIAWIMYMRDRGRSDIMILPGARV